MRSAPHRLVAAAFVALAIALLSVGCGREPAPDLVQGKTLFNQKCGSCHVLNRAGTKGQIGPNLDTAFGPARSAGQGEDTVAGVVEDQISNARTGSAMPRDLVKGREASDVAAYVAMVAGQPGKDTGELAKAGAPKVSNKPVVAASGKLEIDADPTGALAYQSTKATAMAGGLQILSKNASQVQHDIALKGPGGEIGNGPEVANGGTSSFSATLKPGTYEFFCTVPGHEAGGMKGELTVK